ncbi:YbjN domain-containing protein [Egicoccus sp. AB-alg6-2]|uniref:YbjN domain-containing protein n=1 Tax=Egicoccus sp. AB-alg6-2 TaxID=3242692 RepID=UPI00359E3D84
MSGLRAGGGFAFLRDTLEASGRDVVARAELATVAFEHTGEHGHWEVFCHSHDPQPQVTVYSLHPREVPVERRDRMMRLVTQANYGLVIGNFELDLGDGELRFKTSLDHGTDRLSGALLAALIEHNLAAFDRYLPAIDAVLDHDDADADALVADIDGAG